MAKASQNLRRIKKETSHKIYSNQMVFWQAGVKESYANHLIGKWKSSFLFGSTLEHRCKIAQSMTWFLYHLVWSNVSCPFQNGNLCKINTKKNIVRRVFTHINWLKSRKLRKRNGKIYIRYIVILFVIANHLWFSTQMRVSIFLQMTLLIF